MVIAPAQVLEEVQTKAREIAYTVVDALEGIDRDLFAEVKVGQNERRCERFEALQRGVIRINLQHIMFPLLRVEQ